MAGFVAWFMGAAVALPPADFLNSDFDGADFRV